MGMGMGMVLCDFSYCVFYYWRWISCCARCAFLGGGGTVLVV